MGADVIVLHRFPLDRGEGFDAHAHDDHQLIWASAGVLTVEVGARYWVLPTTLGLWMPAGIVHAPLAVRESVMEGLYFDPARTPVDWTEPTVLQMGPLSRQLVSYLARDLGAEERQRAERVLLDTLEPVGRRAIAVPVPADPRARDVARLLLDDPADARSLDEFGRDVGASSRTLLRLFQSETGMSFGTWRTHARIQASVALLAEGEPVSRVAYRVGYSTPSAFIAAFHRVSGTTPGAYFHAGEGSSRADGT
ncbi:helix-turn-helix domain-containing protein [Leifsonia sp. ZF2019]|uniref:helix-turn-helix domain-containing protein n=1 Tax=Leifsonia sp. ZF2019 TaxID=2781978 RepID=UPI001CBC9FBC|nr:helix-turn-helix transcriptional regulator [Leifsonia sp. ZF2019]